MLTSPALRDPLAIWRLGLSLAVLALAVPAWRIAEVDPGLLIAPEGLAAAAAFGGGFFPPQLEPDFLALLVRALVETLAVATAGVFLATLLAVPLAVLATGSLIRDLGRRPPLFWLRGPVRLLLILTRSIPELVWALLFVRAIGLGPWAGVFALAVAYSGMLGKIYAETLESAHRGPGVALLHTGASRLGALLYGFLPGAREDLVSYTVYRWECGVRASVVMGFVGAGGLGQQLELSLRMMNNREVATILLIFAGLVLLADRVSRSLRGRRRWQD